MGLTCYHSFNNDVLDIAPVLVSLVAQRLERLEELSEGLLVPVAEVVKRLIENIFGVVLVDGVVGEVHA